MTETPPCPQVVGVDTGGTFTDFFFIDAKGRIRVHKIPSCPQDPARPVLEALAHLEPCSPSRVVHGTTVGTNALLENKLAKTALVTTAGFEDVLEIGRQQRPNLYALEPRKTPPLISADLRFGINERVLPDGTILVPIDHEEVRALLARIKKLEVESVAVCFLHSYANPVHEELVRDIANQMHVPVSISSEVLREFREYERTATVAVNASLRPIMEGYLTRLERGLGGARLQVMQSTGGSLVPRVASLLPVHTVLSGPAGGVIAAAHVARMVGLDRVITFDMGGTSTDVSLYECGPAYASGRVIGGYPIHVPVIDIHTVGAGGGSIAYRDAGGGLKVGPASAGADPGPVCYGKGNALTVTDAHFFLKRMETTLFSPARLAIDPDRINRPMEALGCSLGLSAPEAAQGILRVADSVMERAIRVISLEQGHDPKDFTLLSFGGCGGLHAAALARHLGIPRVLVPQHAGVFSALGMATAQESRDFSRTVLKRCDALSAGKLTALVQEVASEALAEFGCDQVAGERVIAQTSMDMRYYGQSHELTVTGFPDPVSAFERAHEKRYGFHRPGSTVEIVTVRVRLVAATPTLPHAWEARTKGTGKPLCQRPLLYENTWVPAEIFIRDELPPGTTLQGPALVLEPTATSFVPPSARAEIDGHGNMIIDVGSFSS